MVSLFRTEKYQALHTLDENVPSPCVLSDFQQQESVTATSNIAHVALAKAPTHSYYVPFEMKLKDSRVDRSLKNIELLEKIQEALQRGKSLSFLDTVELDEELLPVPSHELVKNAVQRLNYTAINFLFRVNAERLCELPSLIYESFTRNSNCSSEQCSRFLIRIINEHAPKLKPDFFHVYLAKNRFCGEQDKIQNILATVERCYKIDKMKVLDQLSSQELKMILKWKKCVALGLTEELIKSRMSRSSIVLLSLKKYFAKKKVSYH